MEAWLSGDTATAAAALDRYIDWTPAAATALLESVLNGDLFTICTTTDSVSCTVILESNNIDCWYLVLLLFRSVSCITPKYGIV